MSSLLPAGTNGAYEGNRAAPWFLTLLSVGTIVPGLIHAFLPDGGAGVIAGLDLTQNGRLIIGVFAWAGATQIVWGLALLAVSLRYRSLVPAMFALLLLERSIIALNTWVLKPGEGTHHPPEAFATLVVLPVLAVLLALSLRRRG
ncbi:MAG: hypothetical protein RH982_14630 [Parvibaculum sp.]